MNKIADVWNKAELPIVVGGAALLIAFAAGIWWILQPQYEVLFEKTSEKERGAILAALSDWNIPFRLEPKSGAVEVDAERVDEIRGKLAGAGVVYEVSKGYELFDKADYGLSEFAQKINYQRALEGELSRSIMTLMPVKHARVHLTLAKSSLFTTTNTPSKASVLVQLKPKQNLSSGQVVGIRQLIAAAVEGLSEDHVSILNESGEMLSGGVESSMTGGNGVGDNLELILQDKAVLLTNSIVGDNAAVISVQIQKNLDKVKSVRDDVLPVAGQAGGAVLRKNESRSMSPNSTEQSKVNSSDTSTQIETEYAYSRQRSETDHAVGQVTQISVGVVLQRPVDQLQKESLQSVLIAGLGLQLGRGDMISIVDGAVAPIAARDEQLTSTSKGSTSAQPSQLKSDSLVSDLSSTAMLILTAVVVLLVSIVMMFVYGKNKAVRREEPKKLTVQERERLLTEAKQWLSVGS